MKKILSAAMALGLAVALAAPAAAESSFTVKDAVKRVPTETGFGEVEIFVFFGADSKCVKAGVMPTDVPDNGSKTFKCQGQGQDQCKVSVHFARANVCQDAYNTCNGKALKVPDGATLTVSGTADAVKCMVE